MTAIAIYHNPACGTSRNVLALIRNSGVEPHVIDYLKSPPARALLVEVIARARMTPRDQLRQTGTPYAGLGLGDAALSDAALEPRDLGIGWSAMDRLRKVTDPDHPPCSIRRFDTHGRRPPSIVIL